MQLDNLEHIKIFIMSKVFRITYLINLPKGNVTVIFVSIFYLILHSLRDTFLTPIMRQKR
jgi:hypothetical protein